MQFRGNTQGNQQVNYRGNTPNNQPYGNGYQPNNYGSNPGPSNNNYRGNNNFNNNQSYSDSRNSSQSSNWRTDNRYTSNPNLAQNNRTTFRDRPFNRFLNFGENRSSSTPAPQAGRNFNPGFSQNRSRTNSGQNLSSNPPIVLDSNVANPPTNPPINSQPPTNPPTSQIRGNYVDVVDVLRNLQEQIESYSVGIEGEPVEMDADSVNIVTEEDGYQHAVDDGANGSA